MKVAIAMISVGATAFTIRPVIVSPMVRVTSLLKPAARAPATRKIRKAAKTFGR